MLEAVEEYAIECSMIKVQGSEALDYAADEGVQIHGGYGFHQDYAVERIYRDSRINRIFEGTNEINRLLIAGMLLKRAARGQLALLQVAHALVAQIQAGIVGAADSDEEMRLVKNAKDIVLLGFGLAYEKYHSDLEHEQEILMSLADMVIEAFAMESSLLRARKLSRNGRNAMAADMCAVFLRDAMARIEFAARNVIGTCSEQGTLKANMSLLRQLAAYEPIDAVKLRRNIDARLMQRERYTA